MNNYLAIYDTIWHQKTNLLKTTTNLVFECFHSDIEKAMYDYINSKYYSFQELLNTVSSVYQSMGFTTMEIKEIIHYHCLESYDIDIVESMITQIQEEDYPIYRTLQELDERDQLFEKLYYTMDNIEEEESLEDIEIYESYESFEN